VKISSSAAASASDFPFEVDAEVTAGGHWKACLTPQKVGGDYTITAVRSQQLPFSAIICCLSFFFFFHHLQIWSNFRSILAQTCTGCSHAKAAASIEHVTFGDVWYCSGQSNMALPLVHSSLLRRTCAIQILQFTLKWVHL